MPAATPLINGKTNWEISLDRSKEECDKADRELWPNRFALRARYNAQRQSFLATRIEQERLELENPRRFQVRPSGLFVPVPNTDARPVPENTLPPAGQYRDYMNFRDFVAEPEVREASARTATGMAAVQQEVLGRYRYDNWALGSQTRNTPGSAAPVPERYREPVRDDVQYTPPSDEQKFIQRVGMYSNCNVNVQSKKATFVQVKTYRMFCEQCKATEQVDRAVVECWDANNPQIKAFCQMHRHEVEVAPVVAEEGRKFRG